jgi:hypothetical protein
MHPGLDPEAVAKLKTGDVSLASVEYNFIYCDYRKYAVLRKSLVKFS